MIMAIITNQKSQVYLVNIDDDVGNEKQASVVGAAGNVPDDDGFSTDSCLCDVNNNTVELNAAQPVGDIADMIRQQHTVELQLHRGEG